MKQTTFFALLTCMFIACQPSPPEITPSHDYPIIPQPANLTPGKGWFRINENTRIVLNTEEETFRTAAAQLAILLNKEISVGQPGKDMIFLEKNASLTHPEGYRLVITPYGIIIQASHGAGAFYGAQTLSQLLTRQDNQTSLPCVEIEDQPRFPYRGLHLDVSRHFFPVETIKRYIDLMAMYKLNRFHWHLTDDQGWRIEIKQYPKLQEIASCREETLIGHYNDQPHTFDGKQYCGFYTQDEARDIVQYASERFITVIPEIEMPGHAQAAIAAYPQLGCTGKPIKTATKWGIFEDVYCPNEETFIFLENVLDEVMDIFPSEYIHIGGDECPKTQWKENAYCQELIRREELKDEHGLQSYFIQRIEKFLNEKGRKIIGWDEILEGGLAPNATVMSWRGTEGGIEAAKQGHDVIMTPTSHCYFDYYQSENPGEPLAIGGYLPLEKVYSYEPTPSELSEDEARFILGAQGNVWTEYIPNPQQLEYMAFPRACALAEITWSPAESKNYDSFLRRLSPHIERLQQLNVNVATKIFDVKTNIEAGDGLGVRIALSPPMEGIDLRYTLDGSEPNPGSLLYSEPFFIDKSCTFQARSFRLEQPTGSPAKLDFNLHKAAGKVIRLTDQPAEKYSGNGNGSVINGLTGSDERYGGAEWLGFEGKDFEAEINFGTETTFSSVRMRFFNGKGQWIYPPREVVIAASDDGKNFTEVGKQTVPDREGKICQVDIPLTQSSGTYLKVKAVRFGTIPAGAQGAGHEAWLFVDEIVVE